MLGEILMKISNNTDLINETINEVKITRSEFDTIILDTFLQLYTENDSNNTINRLKLSSKTLDCEEFFQFYITEFHSIAKLCCDRRLKEKKEENKKEKKGSISKKSKDKNWEDKDKNLEDKEKSAHELKKTTNHQISEILVLNISVGKQVKTQEHIVSSAEKDAALPDNNGDLPDNSLLVMPENGDIPDNSLPGMSEYDDIPYNLIDEVPHEKEFQDEEDFLKKFFKRSPDRSHYES
jgi:hypothetical protein